MGQVALEGMRFYAYHGFYKEERKIGNKFVVDLYVDTDFQEAGQTDELQHTIDYGQLYELVREEMEQPAKLLEHVAQRIIESFEVTHKKLIEKEAVQQVTVKISKIHPPVSGQVDKAVITVTENF